MIFPYSINKNPPVNNDRLIDEIRASAIVTALDYPGEGIEFHLGALTVNFRAQLSETDEAILNALVAAHEGQPLPDGQTDALGNKKVSLAIPERVDGVPNFHNTSRPLGTFTYFTGASDDTSDPTLVGGSSGTAFSGHHQVNDQMTTVVYADFNCIKNDTWLHKGAMQWFGARNDELTFEVVPQVTAVTAGTGTNFYPFGGYLIIPAAGNGTINVASQDMRLVQCVPNEFGTMPAGYWDATFNPTTKVFENIAPNLNGRGGYNMFAAEVPLNRFGNRMQVLGDGNVVKNSDDTTQAGHGMRIRLTAKTIGADHEWWWNLHLGMFRKRTA